MRSSDFAVARVNRMITSDGRPGMRDRDEGFGCLYVSLGRSREGACYVWLADGPPCLDSSRCVKPVPDLRVRPNGVADSRVASVIHGRSSPLGAVPPLMVDTVPNPSMLVST